MLALLKDLVGTPVTIFPHFEKKPGHLRARCFKKFPHPRPFRRTFATAAMASVDTNYYSINSDDICLVAEGRDQTSREISFKWLTDSGCTSHMIFDLKSVTTYETLPFQDTKLGNAKFFRVEGVRDVRIALTVDGGNRSRSCKVQN